MSEELKRCPFCGLPPKNSRWVNYKDQYLNNSIECVYENCPIQPTTRYSEDVETLVKEWNTRSPSPSAQPSKSAELPLDEQELLWLEHHKIYSYMDIPYMKELLQQAHTALKLQSARSVPACDRTLPELPEGWAIIAIERKLYGGYTADLESLDDCSASGEGSTIQEALEAALAILKPSAPTKVGE